MLMEYSLKHKVEYKRLNNEQIIRKNKYYR